MQWSVCYGWYGGSCTQSIIHTWDITVATCQNQQTLATWMQIIWVSQTLQLTAKNSAFNLIFNLCLRKQRGWNTQNKYHKIWKIMQIWFDHRYFFMTFFFSWEFSLLLKISVRKCVVKCYKLHKKTQPQKCWNKELCTQTLWDMQTKQCLSILKPGTIMPKIVHKYYCNVQKLCYKILLS